MPDYSRWKNASTYLRAQDWTIGDGSDMEKDLN
jgi:hypothetical protein